MKKNVNVRLKQITLVLILQNFKTLLRVIDRSSLDR